MQAASELARLTNRFQPASRADWLALVAKTLMGAGAETLERRTLDGLVVKPLYTAQDAPRAGAVRQGAGWDIRSRISGDGDVPDEAVSALSAGADSLLVEAFDGGANLARLLDGVFTDVAPVALDAGLEGPAAARALDAVAKASPAAPLAFHLDPLSAFARAGVSPGPIAAHVAAAARCAAGLAETYPKASLWLASGVAAHEAGAGPALEIAVAVAAAIAYAKALAAEGLDMPTAWGRIVLGLAAEAEPMAAVAKMRAARRVWSRITQACGAEAPARIEARASRRMLTRADHWTNLIRLTAAGFGAAVGGADAIVLAPFTEPLGGAPDDLARRQSRNIQLILRDEAGLGAVADPASGCWAIEAQTHTLAHAAWDRLAWIEGHGGLQRALTTGAVAAAVDEARAALAAALHDGSRRIVGVTDFKPSEPAPEPLPASSAPPPATRLAGPDDRCPPLRPVRLEDLAA